MPRFQRFRVLKQKLNVLQNSFDKNKKNENNKEKQKQQVGRNLLVDVLQQQYKTVKNTDAVKKNVELLLSSDTFTITTAHQPNLFTGPLYFIYKILQRLVFV